MFRLTTVLLVTPERLKDAPAASEKAAELSLVPLSERPTPPFEATLRTSFDGRSRAVSSVAKVG